MTKPGGDTGIVTAGRYAGEIAGHFLISGRSISHYLDVLKQAFLVRGIKNGQYVCYALNATVMNDLAKRLLTFKTRKRAK